MKREVIHTAVNKILKQVCGKQLLFNLSHFYRLKVKLTWQCTWLNIDLRSENFPSLQLPIRCLLSLHFPFPLHAYSGLLAAFTGNEKNSRSRKVDIKGPLNDKNKPSSQTTDRKKLWTEETRCSVPYPARGVTPASSHFLCLRLNARTRLLPILFDHDRLHYIIDRIAGICNVLTSSGLTSVKYSASPKLLASEIDFLFCQCFIYRWGGIGH